MPQVVRGGDRRVLGEGSGLGALKARDPVSGWDLVKLLQPLLGSACVEEAIAWSVLGC